MTILVLDIGSSSVRVMLYDAQAHPVPDAHVQQSYKFEYDAQGKAIIDPKYLQTVVEDSITHLLQKADTNEIEAVGITTFASNIMGINANGQPITHLLTYADTRSHTVIDDLKSKFLEDELLQRTGCRLHSAYSSVQLYWLKQENPEKFRQVHQWLDFASYLYLQWFGEARTSYSLASWSGLLNRKTLIWDAQWLELLELKPEQLPTLADTYDTFSNLVSDYNHYWGAIAKVPFYLAIGDGAVANIGSGGINPNNATLTVGSTSAIRYITDDPLPPVPQGLWGYRVTKNQHLIGGAMTEGGTSFAWGRDTLAVSDDQLSELSIMRPDAHGLTVLPLFAGERSPNWNAKSTATLHGLALSTTPVQILQAILESVAFRLADIADSLLSKESNIMVNGGAIDASPVWAQIIANSLKRPLHHVSGEMSARGVAIVILSDLYQKEWSNFIPKFENTFSPQSGIVPIYEAARKRQKTLYEMLYGTNQSKS